MLFVRLDYADVAAWREWLPLPGQIASGTGALRIWSKVAGQELLELVADVELANVKAKFAPDLPEIALAHLSGRVGTRKSGPQREVFARGLAFTTLDGQQLDPTNFTLAWREGPADRMDSARIEFDRLQLAPLVALSAHLPLPDRIRADLARFAPRGTLTHGRLAWAGGTEAPTSFDAAAEFTDLGLVAQDAFPGTTGLSGRFEATNDGGEIRIAGTHVTLDLPRALPAPIVFDTLQSVVKWERRDGTTKVKLEQLVIANADISGGASGTYRTLAERTRRNRNRRSRVARRCPADPSLSAAIDRRSHAALARRGARQRQRGRRPPQADRKSRRLSFCQRQRRQTDVQHEGEGGDACPHERLAGHRRHRCRRSDRRYPTDHRRGAGTRA